MYGQQMQAPGAGGMGRDRITQALMNIQSPPPVPQFPQQPGIAPAPPMGQQPTPGAAAPGAMPPAAMPGAAPAGPLAAGQPPMPGGVPGAAAPMGGGAAPMPQQPAMTPQY
jgi:hypothetical protein